MTTAANFTWLGAALLAAGLQQAMAAPVVAYTDSNGREWRQVKETVGLAYTDIKAACSGSQGLCSGSVGNIQLEGWHFAVNADVYQLFVQTSIPMTGNTATGYGSASGPSGSTWAAAFIDVDGVGGDAGYFDANWLNESGAWVMGFVRDQPASLNYRYTASVMDIKDNLTSRVDGAGTANLVHRDAGDAPNGYWLYRDAAVTSNALPLPGTLPLAGLALAGLAALRRRRR